MEDGSEYRDLHSSSGAHGPVFPFRGMTHARKTVYSLVYLCGEMRLNRLWMWVTEKED
jgi:hypothetical protein